MRGPSNSRLDASVTSFEGIAEIRWMWRVADVVTLLNRESAVYVWNAYECKRVCIRSRC